FSYNGNWGAISTEGIVGGIPEMHAPVAVVGKVSVFDNVMLGAHHIDAIPLMLRDAALHHAFMAVTEEDASAMIVLRFATALINNGSGRQVGIPGGGATNEFDPDASLDHYAPKTARHGGILDGHVPGICNRNADPLLSPWPNQF